MQPAQCFRGINPYFATYLLAFLSNLLGSVIQQVQSLPDLRPEPGSFFCQSYRSCASVQKLLI